MQLAPRYDGVAIIQLDGPVDAVRTPLVRQRRRLAALLDGLDDAGWASPTRCADWDVRDVVSHLADTDGYWALSLQEGLAGRPTRMLDGFDPASTPAALVGATAGASPAEVAERSRASTAALLDALDALDAGGPGGSGGAGWETVVEAPPGHVTAAAMVHHALWDGWVHERDIALPLGLTPAEEDDEVLACLRYAAALGPAFALQTSPDRRGALALAVTDPDATVVVEVDGAARVHLTLAGPAVPLLEALSVRVPLPGPVDERHAWLVSHLATVFESGPASGPAATR